MATTRMSNRRVKRPYGGFLRSKRRSGLDTLAMLEAASAPAEQGGEGGGLKRIFAGIFRRLLNRR
jgi:hypothetical protein